MSADYLALRPPSGLHGPQNGQSTVQERTSYSAQQFKATQQVTDADFSLYSTRKTHRALCWETVLGHDYCVPPSATCLRIPFPQNGAQIGRWDQSDEEEEEEEAASQPKGSHPAPTEDAQPNTGPEEPNSADEESQDEETQQALDMEKKKACSLREARRDMV